MNIICSHFSFMIDNPKRNVRKTLEMNAFQKHECPWLMSF